MSRLLRCVATASLGLGLIAALPLSASAAEFTWSAPTDPQTMDPHEVNTTPVLGFLNNIYEGLVRRNAEMAIEGSLAERWEALASSSETRPREEEEEIRNPSHDNGCNGKNEHLKR